MPYIPVAVVEGAGSSSLTSVDFTLSGDVTMTNASQFYDGPSGDFSAGTWFVVWKVMIFDDTNQTKAYTVRLWDGATTYDESEIDTTSGSANANTTIMGMAVLTLGSTTTLKISALSARAGDIMQRDVDQSSAGTHTATRLCGVKIA